MHQAMGRHGVFPCEGLVDAGGAAIVLQRQIVGALDKAEVRAIERLSRRYAAMRFGVGADWFGVGRFEAETARYFDRAQQDLQQVQGAAGLKAVGMGGNSAHGMEADRAARHGFVGLAAEIRPFMVQLEGLVKGDAGQFGGNGADFFWLYAAVFGHGLGRVLIV